VKRVGSLKHAVSACCAAFLFTSLNLAQAPGGYGLFEGHGDVGNVQKPGSVKYAVASRTYTITSGGENMWAATDDFHFLWKRLSGDVSLAADLAILGTGGNAHRKGVLMIRQSLDTDSAYASVALHGDGLTALQAREAKGAQTYEVKASVSAPTRLLILKRGQSFYMWLDGRMAGGSFRIPLEEPFYVGLGVCAHDNKVSETVRFSNVELTTPAAGRKPEFYSTLETVSLTARSDRQAVLVADGRMEAPSWTPDGASLLFNSGGRTRRVQAAGGAAETIAPGTVARSDGSPQKQPPSDEYSNWYPRISPNGRWMLFLSCDKSVKGEPRDVDVTLRLMSLPEGKISLLAKLIGGQGTLGASPWSPDSRSVTFVSYQPIR